MTQPTLAFIGAGTLGTALAHGATAAGYTVTAVFSRTFEDAKRLADPLPKAKAASSIEEVISADLIFLTVPDDEILGVCIVDYVDRRVRCLADRFGSSFRA